MELFCLPGSLRRMLPADSPTKSQLGLEEAAKDKLAQYMGLNIYQYHFEVYLRSMTL